ncbi:MAG: hypothetical protein IT320_21050 [Anaerolineae bacterium]|nr:hypothetical protein [Anaerolineae bacterium]
MAKPRVVAGHRRAAFAPSWSSYARGHDHRFFPQTRSLNTMREASHRTKRINIEDSELSDVYRFLVSYFEENGNSPSYREIAVAIGLTHPTARQRVLLLKSMGYVCVRKKTARSISLIKPIIQV